MSEGSSDGLIAEELKHAPLISNITDSDHGGFLNKAPRVL